MDLVYMVLGFAAIMGAAFILLVGIWLVGRFLINFDEAIKKYLNS